MERRTVGILGAGTLGRAIAEGLLASGFPAEHLAVTVRSPARAAELRQAGLTVCPDNVALIEASAVVVVCVKPQSLADVLGAPGVAEAARGRVLVSVAAGVRLARLCALVPDASIIRAMPNTPLVIREGMTVLAPAAGVSPEDVGVVERLFGAVGRVRVLDERHLDAVTGLSGSGPAFAFVMLESLADGGVMMGLPRAVAIELAAQTMLGAARLVLERGEHPAALKDQVTTPAGCTIAGLLTMEDGRIRSTLARTIQEATRVASGLG
jgi:pyrroline-5-carboxylate reductase